MIGLETIRGALLDIDGTLLSNDRAIPGAAGALARLRLRGVALRLVTNTTRRPRAATAAVLRAVGFEVADEEVLAPASLARRRILASGKTRAALLVPPAARQDFDGVEEVQEGPAWVVVGDIGRDFTWDRLNQAFSWIKDGATLLALHKNRCWDPGIGRMVLDVGPFIAALEYATGKVAELVGKPSPDFFTLALEDLGLPAGDVLVVGDDLEADALGGATAGCRVAIVLSGKTTREDLDRATARPDLVVASVADLFP
ncbi:MAG TPA: HAD-IIA family hydrolase [Candidatus Polarisedimenticolia bacterium]|nr:HAD-IIA family hydrolase [Candidatus Polarisedimenticolia bacterium]